MTNKEIWEKELVKDVSFSIAAIASMELARKDEAISFTDWKAKNKWQPIEFRSGYMWWDSTMGSEHKTSEELYSLFKKDTNGK